MKNYLNAHGNCGQPSGVQSSVCISDTEVFYIETPAVLGMQGLSAYQVAVKNGFEGTEEQWLSSLKATIPVTESDNGKVMSNDGQTVMWVTLSSSDVGLGNVDNTSDEDKPISVAQQEALDTKVDKVAGKQLSDENFTASEKSKLAGLENYDDTEVRGLIDGKVDKVAGKGLSTNDLTDPLYDKLVGLEGTHWRGTFPSLSALQSGVTDPQAGDYADVDVAGEDVQRYIWDATDNKWVVQSGGAAPITAAQVKMLYESNPDTNAFKDSEKDKLEGIEDGATANSADSYLLNRANHTGVQEIGTVAGLEASLNSKADQTSLDAVASSKVDKVAGKGLSDENYTLAEKNKLSGIEAGATANATDAQLRDRATHTGVQPISSITNLQSSLDSKVDKVAGYGLSQENYTPAEKSKLASIEGSKFKGEYVSLAALQAAHPSPEVGSYAYVDLGVGEVVSKYIWDSSDVEWVKQQGETASLTPAEIKSLYEGNPDTNAFTDSEKTKLSGIQAGATANATDAQLRDRATHTGVQPISSVSGLQTELDNKADTAYVNTQLDGKVDKTVSVVAGTGLEGGGTLSTSRTLNVQYGTTAGTAAQGNDARINNGQTAFGWGNHATAGYFKSISSLGVENLDSITASGFYQQATSANASVANNYPNGAVAGMLRHYEHSSYKEQYYSNRDGGRTWYRTYYISWNDWVEFIHTGNLDSNVSDLGFVKSSGLSGYVPTTRTITAGTGLSGGGTLAADRTLSVNFGTTAGTVKEGNWLPSAATKAQVLSGSASDYVTGSSYINTIAWNTSSHSSGTVTLDLDTSLNHILNIAGDVTIGAPSNATLGKTGDIVLRVNADVVVGWDTQWKFLGSVPNIGANGEVWVVSYKVLSATEILASASKVV